MIDLREIVTDFEVDPFAAREEKREKKSKVKTRVLDHRGFILLFPILLPRAALNS